MVVDDYYNRMRNCYQFKQLGIDPVWTPGTKDIEGFCRDEVVRQFHDTRVWEDGGKRVEWMLDAWSYAETSARLTPTINDVLMLGALVEPGLNSTVKHPNGVFRHENVYIGNRMGVYPAYIWRCVDALVDLAGDVEPGLSDPELPYQFFVEGFKTQLSEGLVKTVDDWYLAYEWIHPFADGNGRSGKVLHNWLNDTLDDPVLVPDYFGGGNP